MKIRHLFESEMILLESYKDFRRVWEEMLDTQISLGKSNVIQLMDNKIRETDTPRILSVFGVRMKDVEGIPQFIELLLKNQKYKSILIKKKFDADGRVRRPLDISSWISVVNKNKESTLIFIDIVASVLSIREEIVDEINSDKPEYTTVKKTPEYIIFDVKNFAAAQKLRNQVGATWCIGANGGHFDFYGAEQGRKTYIIFFLKTKKGMVVHVNPNNTMDNLITDHSNDGEATIIDSNIVNRRGGDLVKNQLSYSLEDHQVEELFASMRIKVDFQTVDASINDKIINELTDFHNRIKRIRTTVQGYESRMSLPDLGEDLVSKLALTRNHFVYDVQFIKILSVILGSTEFTFKMFPIINNISNEFKSILSMLVSKIAKFGNNPRELERIDFRNTEKLIDLVNKWDEFTNSVVKGQSGIPAMKIKHMELVKSSETIKRLYMGVE
jgi:hypothetical protein